MPLRLAVQAIADIDLQDHAAWLRGEAGEEVAERFLAAADREFHRLTEAPGLGAPVQALAPELADACKRRGRVTGFPGRLIFYTVEEDTLVVLCVLHAKQNWKRG